MKKLLFAVCLTLSVKNCFEQSVGIGTNSPAATAQLDIASTNKGILIPRLNTTQRTGIASPATGLLVFDTDSSAFAYYTGSAWFFLKGINGVTNDWNTLVNSGTNPSNHLIGTTDNVALKFRTANTASGEIHPTNGNSSFGFNSNTAIGYEAMNQNNSGGGKTAIGRLALNKNTIASDNTATGFNSMFNTTIGKGNAGATVDHRFVETAGGSR